MEQNEFIFKAKGMYEPYPKNIARFLNEDVVFTFRDGLPAFEEAKRFVLVISPQIKPFLYLKSLDVEGLGFICIDPFTIKKDYSVKIPGKDLALLQLKNKEDAFILSFVTVDENPEKTTANLLAPVILNVERSFGRQVILEEENPVRYNIWEGIQELQNSTEEEL